MQPVLPGTWDSVELMHVSVNDDPGKKWIVQRFGPEVDILGP
jgi:hypothetical protein